MFSFFRRGLFWGGVFSDYSGIEIIKGLALVHLQGLASQKEGDHHALVRPILCRDRRQATGENQTTYI